MSESNKRRIRDANSGPETLIAEGFKFEGKISGRGNFMISGEVEGECDIEGTVTLAKNGLWRGTIKADSVIVAGIIEGDIDASGRVEICDTARVSGTVSSEAIAVAAGAVVDSVMQTAGRETPTKFIEKRLTEEE
jgi:cytoskeletal protein CcmA (bactofilin family)